MHSPLVGTVKVPGRQANNSPHRTGPGQVLCHVLFQTSVAYASSSMFRCPYEIETALAQLGKRLLYADAPHITIVVCGGSALQIQGLSTRTTQDVDVCAAAVWPADSPEASAAAKLPESFVEAVQAVAEDLGLHPGWLDTAAAEVLAVYGSPPGMEGRLVARGYGPLLRVLFVSRLDQIHFKVLAAADPKAPERHFEDLIHRLRPTPGETRMAVAWLLDRKTTSWMRGNVRHVVEVLGHADIARDIPQ